MYVLGEVRLELDVVLGVGSYEKRAGVWCTVSPQGLFQFQRELALCLCVRKHAMSTWVHLRVSVGRASLYATLNIRRHPHRHRRLL